MQRLESENEILRRDHAADAVGQLATVSSKLDDAVRQRDHFEGARVC